jgi:hypothetical protein
MVIFALSACAASKVKYTVLDQGVHSGKQFPSLHFEVIGEKARFEKLFAEIHSGQLPPPSPPKIDFEKSLAIFISLGKKPSTGYRVKIEAVTRDDETLRVKIGVQEPAKDEFQAMVMTQPYILIKIKKEPGIEKIALIDAEGNVIQSQSIPRAF